VTALLGLGVESDGWLGGGCVKERAAVVEEGGTEEPPDAKPPTLGAPGSGGAGSGGRGRAGGPWI
jgi:hypothetical protein